MLPKKDAGMGKSLSKRQLAAVVAGNALEFYDFLIFSFFAVQLSQVFFPSVDKTASLLSTLAIYGAGFLTRPIGGIVIGRLGDRLGRKPTMLFSFGLMGLSIMGLALTPSYASIGMAAPALALLFRLAQGFALGGEIGPTTTFLLEAAPSARPSLIRRRSPAGTRRPGPSPSRSSATRRAPHLRLTSLRRHP
jgi:MHS family citrate/tricarballylate:H+ symporter-like MFS transporter